MNNTISFNIQDQHPEINFRYKFVNNNNNLQNIIFIGFISCFYVIFLHSSKHYHPMTISKSEFTQFWTYKNYLQKRQGFYEY